MNNGTTDATHGAPRVAARTTVNEDAIAQTKRELLQAEIRLAKARATTVSAEIDIKTLTARLRGLAK